VARGFEAVRFFSDSTAGNVHLPLTQIPDAVGCTRNIKSYIAGEIVMLLIAEDWTKKLSAGLTDSDGLTVSTLDAAWLDLRHTDDEETEEAEDDADDDEEEEDDYDDFDDDDYDDDDDDDLDDEDIDDVDSIDVDDDDDDLEEDDLDGDLGELEGDDDDDDDL